VEGAEVRKDENENGVGKFGDHTTPFSANPISMENDGDTFMNSTDVSRASTAKAPQCINQVDNEALDRIDDLPEEIIECELEELQYGDNAVVEFDEADAASVETTSLPKNNNVINMASAKAKPVKAKSAASITTNQDGAEITPRELLEEMDATANRIRDLHGKGSAVLVAIGRDLIAMKDRLKHGEFTKWYRGEFGWNAMDVKRYMDGARAWDDIRKLEPEAEVKVIPQTLLYSFGKLSESQQLQIAQAAKTGRKLKADDFKKANTAASPRKTDKGEAEALANLIAGLLDRSAAERVASSRGFEVRSFGSLLQKAITATFSGNS